MNRDRCIVLLNKFVGIDSMALTIDEVEEVLVDYVCDRGYSDKKSYVPVLMAACYVPSLLHYAFEYYRKLFNIYTVRLPRNPNSTNSETGKVIYIY